MGAALIAALTIKRIGEGRVMGIRNPEDMLKGTAAEKVLKEAPGAK